MLTFIDGKEEAEANKIELAETGEYLPSSGAFKAPLVAHELVGGGPRAQGAVVHTLLCAEIQIRRAMLTGVEDDGEAGAVKGTEG